MELCHCFLVCLSHVILLLERYESYLLPSLLEILHCLLVALITLEFICLDLLDQTLLCLEISVIVILRLCMLVPFSEEIVTSCTESLPKLLRLLARHCSNFLPLLLKTYELVCSLLPFSAYHKCLSLLAESDLLVEVCVDAVLIFIIELTLALIELVASRTESVIDLLVILLGSKTDGSPLLLDILDLLRACVPLI